MSGSRARRRTFVAMRPGEFPAQALAALVKADEDLSARMLKPTLAVHGACAPLAREPSTVWVRARAAPMPLIGEELAQVLLGAPLERVRFHFVRPQRCGLLVLCACIPFSVTCHQEREGCFENGISLLYTTTTLLYKRPETSPQKRARKRMERAKNGLP